MYSVQIVFFFFSEKTNSNPFYEHTMLNVFFIPAAAVYMCRNVE